MKLKNYFLVLLLVCGLSMQAQETFGPTSTGVITSYEFVPSIAEQMANGTLKTAENDADAVPAEAPPKRRIGARIVPGKSVKQKDLALQAEDALIYSSRAPILTFEADENSPFGVTDPTGAVGPNHYIAAWNTGFRIFDKSGNPLTPEALLGTILTGNNTGDPIVLYDKFADRFLITEFDDTPNGFEVAVSAGPNPVTDGWHVYTNVFPTGVFPDYTKFSIWPDGYYVTANIGSANRVFVVEREQMLDGLAAQFVAFPLPGISAPGPGGFYSPQVFNAGSGMEPAAGNATVVFLQDDAFAGITEDHIKLWTINVDWTDTAASTVSAPVELAFPEGVSPFNAVFDGGSFSNAPQLGGPDVDVLQQTISNQAQFRKFATHNSVVFNFAVDIAGPGEEQAGIRWYELRQDSEGMPWEVYQEGTYVSNDDPTRYTYQGSMAMDSQGNIGMGYITSKADERIAVRYTGRFALDPLGTMSVAEQTIGISTAANPGVRFADYVHLTVDPADGDTFWHIAEYFTPGRDDIVGVFKIAPDLANDVGVIAINEPSSGTLSDTETVEILVRNFGTDTQSDIPVSFSVDGGTVINEVFPGPIAVGENATYTFTATADMGTLGTTYSISAQTNLVGDEFIPNDGITKEVTFLQPDDVGVISIDSPSSGFGLSDAESVTVTVENFGGEPQTDIPVFYTLDGGAAVNETVPGPLNTGETTQHTFAGTVDLSTLGTYEFTAGTELVGDSDESNDDTAKTVENQLCQPEMNCSFGDGFQLVQGGGIDNPSGCEGYADFTDQIGEFPLATGTDMTFTTGYGDQFIRVWIDFNDDFVFTLDELVIDNVEIASGSAAGTFTETFTANVPDGVPLGQHLMRCKSNWDGPVPTDACAETTYGETEDYTADVVPALGVADEVFGESEMIIIDRGNNQFEVQLNNPAYTDLLNIRVVNTLGQIVLSNWVQNENGGYTYPIDMSYAASGVYLVRLGTTKQGQVKRIIVR